MGTAPRGAQVGPAGEASRRGAHARQHDGRGRARDGQAVLLVDLPDGVRRVQGGQAARTATLAVHWQRVVLRPPKDRAAEKLAAVPVGAVWASETAAPPLAQAVRWVAQWGGYLGRTGDGPPGVTVLWRGFQRLGDLTSLYHVFRPPLRPRNVGKG